MAIPKLLRPIIRPFIAGLIAVLPIGLTVAIIAWLAGIATKLFGPGSAVGSILKRFGWNIGPTDTGAYLGGVLFAVMLTRSSDYPRISDNKQWPLAAIAALALLGVLVPAFVINRVEGTQAQNASFTGIGESLFTTWAVPFEIASLVLLVALIGAIIIARSGRGES